MDKIKELHLPGWKGLKYLLYLRIKKYYKVLTSALLISITLLVFLLFKSPVYTFSLTNTILDLILSFFPNLLGFSLGGFAIVVGFSNTDLIKSGAKTDKPSVYQILNSNFTCVIVFQIIITSMAFLIKWVMALKIIVPFNDTVCNLINSLAVSAFLFQSIFLMLLTFDIVINLFTLSQVNSVYYTIKKVQEDKIDAEKAKQKLEEEKKG